MECTRTEQRSAFGVNEQKTVANVPAKIYGKVLLASEWYRGSMLQSALLPIRLCFPR
jgi:hypothetical protein